MIRLARRRFLLLGLTAPAVAPDVARAAILPPLKERPARSQPLGVWGIVDRKIEVGIGTPATVNLLFRSKIDVARPVMKWWVPRWLPLGPVQTECAPTVSATASVLPAMVAGVQVPVSFRITPPVPPKPPNVYRGEERSERVKAIQVGQRKRMYRAFVEVVDPVTCRRATFGFNLTVLDAYPA